MRRLLFYCSLLFVVILLFSCSKETKEEIEKPSDELTAQQKEGKELAESLWATSPLQEQPLDENRTLTFERIQEYADKCTSDYFESYLKSRGILHSFSRKGNPYDNACIESFHSILKKEEVYTTTYYSFKETKLALFEYIESFYNRKRRHSALGFKTPQQIEDEALSA